MSRIWDTATVKLAAFHPKALTVIRSFSRDVRREIGKVVFDLQAGVKLTMPLSRSMPTVAVGAHELRIRDRSGIYRVFYYTKLANSVLIFHAVTKKSQKTPQHEIALARERLKEMLDEER
ncbi:MAG TPA: type II toxin-antitoxin system RelE/ParE family toxin [Pyrinomonadaceae bacterium]